MIFGLVRSEANLRHSRGGTHIMPLAPELPLSVESGKSQNSRPGSGWLQNVDQAAGDEVLGFCGISGHVRRGGVALDSVL
jgi:hypothetical protein